jgi:hypothetical protein
LPSELQPSQEVFNTFMTAEYETKNYSSLYGNVVGASPETGSESAPDPESSVIVPQSVGSAPSNFENHRNKHYVTISLESYKEFMDQ